jgi:hypothetical protein
MSPRCQSNRPNRTFAAAACLIAALLAPLDFRLFADDPLDDVRTAAQPTAAPATEPTALDSDITPPSDARTGTITLSDDTPFNGPIWTTPHKPFRIWVDADKTYHDLDLASVQQIDVVVDSARDEPEWRWLKEGSDQKVYSGKTYPALILRYRFTLSDRSTVTGAVTAPIYCVSEGKLRTLPLYKTYNGPIGKTLNDVAYIKQITLGPIAATDTPPDANGFTRHLPLIADFPAQ